MSVRGPAIGRELIFVDQYNRKLAALGEAAEGEDTTVAEARQEFKSKLAKAEKTIVASVCSPAVSGH